MSTSSQDTHCQQRSKFQFSIMSLLVAMVLTGLALAFPGFAIFVPFVIGMSVITVFLILAVAIVNFAVSENRSQTFRWAWHNVKGIVIVNAFLIAYMIYAFNVIDWSE